MSKAAYESYFGRAAPPGSHFGADVSWYQGAGSYADTMGYWQDFNNWCSWVNIRTSYGRSGDDGNQNNHFQCANDIGFRNNGRTLGTYHYVIPTSGVDGNFSNYISRSAPFTGITTHDMLDFEEGPNPGAAFINEFCDRVQQARQRPCFIYGGKSYLDGAGSINCPVERIWLAHYPGRSADAWSPTTSWSSNGAPLMPNQYGAVVPGCWQWSSTAIGYSLDLDITTRPDMFGIGGLGPATIEDDMYTDDDRARSLYLQGLIQQIFNFSNTAASASVESQRIGNAILPIADRARAIVERMNTDIYVNSTGGTNLYDDIKKLLSRQSTGGLDIEALASSIAVALGPSTVDYEAVRKIVKEELGKLTVTQKG